jgi:hypothetical protein
MDDFLSGEFAVYDLGTGKILRTHSGFAVDAASYVVDGQWLLLLPTDVDAQLGVHYIDVPTDKVMQREDFPALNIPPSVIANTPRVIRGLPAKTTVVWPDGYTSEESGELTFEVNLPGAYVFRFESVKHLPMEVTIDVE